MPNGFRLAHSDGCQRFLTRSRDLLGEELLRRKELLRTAGAASDADPPQVRIVGVLHLVPGDDPAHLLRRGTAFFAVVGRDDIRRRARSIAHGRRKLLLVRVLVATAPGQAFVRPSAVSRKTSRRQAEAARWGKHGSRTHSARSAGT